MNKLFFKYIQSFDIDKSIDGILFSDCVSDILDHVQVQNLSEYMHHMSVNRLQHVISVSFLSYLLCRRLGLDYRAAARGALLHDLFHYNRSEEKTVKFHTLRHPKTALQNARRFFNLSKKEESIIKRHMWPLTITPPTNREAFIVCMVDKYCAVLEAYYSFFPHRLLKKKQAATTLT
ncbi:MAG: HDIG domain-containing protein [Clostridiales bacterium]|nr:HDIG domain-containing protein [Clostridiales bacterium]